MEKLISIIIPCYNVEQYIDRCLSSLVHQTIGIERLELILVNDASTDGTYEKLLQWEQKYQDSIMVITYDENLRQGGARNIGMQYASAEYIGFVDSDDWVELDMYETLYHILQTQKYDIVRGKFIRDDGNKNIEVLSRCDYSYNFGKIGSFYQEKIENTGNNGEYGSICTGIYRKQIILENDIWFPENIAYEDNFWGSILTLYIGSLYIVDKIIYHYFVNMNSTVTKRNASYHLDRLTIEVGILEQYKKRGAFDLFYHALEWGFIERYYLNTLYILFTRFDDIPNVFNEMKQQVFKYFPNYMNNEKIKGCTPRQQQLLRLLEIPGELTKEQLQRIQAAYLVSMVSSTSHDN